MNSLAKNLANAGRGLDQAFALASALNTTCNTPWVCSSAETGNAADHFFSCYVGKRTDPNWAKHYLQGVGAFALRDSPSFKEEI